MPVTLLDAKARLEAEDLYVSLNNPNSLWVAATVRELGEGVRVSDDASSLIWDGNRWTAVFPAEGILTYEVRGSLPDLVALIASVYSHYRRVGGSFRNAFPRSVREPDQYLVGRSPAPV